MTELRGVITYKRSPEMLMKQFRPLLKEGLKAVGLFWHRTFLPKHFKPGAGRSYRYKPRTRAHVRRKLRLFGHRRPLEFTGKSKRMALREARVGGTSKRVKVKLRVPTYFYQYREGAPNKAKELTKLTRAEAMELALFLDKDMGERLAKVHGSERVKV